MLRFVISVAMLVSLGTFASDEKAGTVTSNSVKATTQTDEFKEPKFIVVESKKIKNYSIYTVEGVYVTEGVLDLNSRVEVTSLNSGNYLVVLGKKAFQFTIQ
jgi:hypothetical protein